MPSPDFEKFLASTKIGYYEWHDGIGFDLEALARLEGDEREQAEEMLLEQSESDWRYIEGLDCLGSPRALAAIERALGAESIEVRMDATARLIRRGLLDAARIEAILLEALDSTTILNGMVRTLRLARTHATPAIRRKLLACALGGNDDIRVHAAALVHFLYGRSSAEFDWKKRPFYLRFGSSSEDERRSAYLELCREIGVEPEL